VFAAPLSPLFFSLEASSGQQRRHSTEEAGKKLRSMAAPEEGQVPSALVDDSAMPLAADVPSSEAIAGQERERNQDQDGNNQEAPLDVAVGDVSRLSTPLRMFPISNYGFGQKDAVREKDSSVPERLARMRTAYQRTNNLQTFTNWRACLTRPFSPELTRSSFALLAVFPAANSPLVTRLRNFR
jgi:hypothetical protein